MYRLITANTVDQRIVEVAHEKRRLEKMVIHKGKFYFLLEWKIVHPTTVLHGVAMHLHKFSGIWLDGLFFLRKVG